MKKVAIYLSAFVLAAGLHSCNKGSTSTPTPPANTPPSVTAPSDAWGAMVVVKLKTAYTTPAYPGLPSQTIAYNVGTAAAVFYNAVGATTFVDAGTTKVNDSLLTKLQNNGYAFSPTGIAAGSDLGLNLNGYSHNWTVSGSSNVTALSYSHSGYLPNIGDVVSSTDVATNAAYTLTVDGTSYTADSMIWVLAGPSGHVQHVTGPGVFSNTFSASEVGTVGKGDNQGLVQVAPYFINSTTLNGKKYYFIKESCATKTVSLK
jgi:hypothetical protein